MIRLASRTCSEIPVKTVENFTDYFTTESDPEATKHLKTIYESLCKSYKLILNRVSRKLSNYANSIEGQIAVQEAGQIVLQQQQL